MKHRALLALWLMAVLASAAPAQPQPDLGSDEQRAAGKVVYDKWCAQCHGDDGAGEGIAAPYVHPKPRDFTSAKYKIRSTRNGSLPTDADIRDVIRDGIPATAMPAFPELSDTEVTNLVYYLKSLAEGDFSDPSAYSDPFEFPDPPPFSEDSLEVGFKTYVEIGCAQCHGQLGRGDGKTAPTLRDDWGHFIRAADLTMPWTFRAGGTREAIFKTLTTGFNGTPMPGFADGLTQEQRWQIVDWIVAQAEGRTEAPYTNLLKAVGTTADLSFEQGLETVRQAFDEAPPALFPVIGQIMEPGRAFHPSVVAVEVRSVYDGDEIAFLVTWHDMKAEVSGHNGPDLEVPLDEETTGLPEVRPAEAAQAVETDIWGNPVGGAPAAAPAPADPWAQDAGTAAAAEAVPESEFSDAVAIQLPLELREGVAKPYFLLGDPQYPVHLWFVDLAQPESVQVWEGRGSANLTPAAGEPPEVLAGYDRGEWAVVFKRPRRVTSGVAFAEGEFVPVAFSVWDGFAEERGSKRGLTRWVHVYLDPIEKPSVWGPMIQAFLTVLLIELLIIGLVRWRQRRAAAKPAPSAEPSPAGG